MRLQHLIDLAAERGISPEDLVVALVTEADFEQEWNVTADIHEATSNDEPSLLVIYGPEAGEGQS